MDLKNKPKLAFFMAKFSKNENYVIAHVAYHCYEILLRKWYVSVVVEVEMSGGFVAFFCHHYSGTSQRLYYKLQ